jgi:hypothetical protein
MAHDIRVVCQLMKTLPRDLLRDLPVNCQCIVTNVGNASQTMAFVHVPPGTLLAT